MTNNWRTIKRARRGPWLESWVKAAIIALLWIIGGLAIGWALGGSF